MEYKSCQYEGKNRSARQMAFRSVCRAGPAPGAHAVVLRAKAKEKKRREDKKKRRKIDTPSSIYTMTRQSLFPSLSLSILSCVTKEKWQICFIFVGIETPVEYGGMPCVYVARPLHQLAELDYLNTQTHVGGEVAGGRADGPAGRLNRCSEHLSQLLPGKTQGGLETANGQHCQNTPPVTGASMSIIVFSCRRRAAPSLMMRRAAASSMRPSRTKCCLRTSGRGLPVLASNTSATDNLRLGGNGTPKKEKKRRKNKPKYQGKTPASSSMIPGARRTFGTWLPLPLPAGH